MDGNTILLMLLLACDLFLLSVIAVLRLAFPPVKPIELSTDDREHVQRAYRDKNSA